MDDGDGGRMRRRIFKVVSILSLLVCVASVVAGFDSREMYVACGVRWWSNGDVEHDVTISAFEGVITVSYVHDDYSGGEWRRPVSWLWHYGPGQK